jgi:hypothetical protein
MSVKAAAVSVLAICIASSQPWQCAVAAGTDEIRSLTGRVLFRGEPPEPRMLEIPLRLRVRRDGIAFDTEELPERRRLMERGVPDETLIVGEERGIKNVIVWLRSREVPVPDPPPGQAPPVTLRAVGGRFVPHVLVYWNISRIQLVNDTGTGTNFNLQVPRSNRVLRDGEEVEIESPKRGLDRLPHPVTSNIQPWFKAFTMVLNHPYFAVTGEDGRFKIDNLPAGEWDFAMWHELSGYLATDKYPAGRFKLKIEDAETDLGDLTADFKAHLRRIRAHEQLFLHDPPKARLGVNAVSELHQAVMAGDMERMRHLLRHGIEMNVNDREPRLYCTALHLAARHGHSEIARVLIEKGATVDAGDIHSCTPLMWAAKGGHVDVARELLDAEAKIDATDHRGWTPLHFAVDRGHAEVAQFLIDRGANRSLKDRNGKTPMDLKLDHEDRASP